MTHVCLPVTGLSVNAVLAAAFKALKCEPWGGPSTNGWSRVSDFLRCPYRYNLKHVRCVSAGPTPTTSTAQSVGSYVHALLACHYARPLPDDRYPGFRSNCPTPDDLLAAFADNGADMAALQVAERLWSGYQDKWGDDGWTPMAVEMAAGNPSLHTCRYDMIVHVDDGTWRNGLWIAEHKSSAPSVDLELFQLDGEIMGEMMAFKMDRLDEIFGGRLCGVVVNALVKSKTPAYHRIWIPVNWELVNDFAKNRGQWQTNINFCEKHNIWMRNHHGCTSRYDKCVYWEHCRTLSEDVLVPLPPKDAL